ncbi:MAG: deoxyguanosinetriphosphate triphosphohydrolase [Acidobacteriota bacterium]
MASTDRPDLAPYAARAEKSRGRRHPESLTDERTAFEHDRDRIIHCAAFRRLEYKTQVFVNHEGDYYRTRLTHTLEVAQLSRSIARRLALNEDLAETIALSHDLGHPPFGHSGERVLNNLMKGHGGFEHNYQSLRIVEELEERYPDFPGLNLTWEAREGIAKHSTHLPRPGKDYLQDYDPGIVPTLESQIIGLADEIAYNNHDIDDGLKSGLIAEEELSPVRIWKEAYKTVARRWPMAGPKLWKYRAVSHIISQLVDDLVETTRKNVREAGIETLEDLRLHNKILVDHSKEVSVLGSDLKQWLNKNLYRHHKVERMRVKSEQYLRGLFGVYTQNPRLLPREYQGKVAEKGLPRVVCDYVAGMTDRYAIEEYRRLFEPEVI